jgi:hypothetical protein
MLPELLFPALGVLLVALGWPIATRRVRPNHWYGLRGWRLANRLLRERRTGAGAA